VLHVMIQLCHWNCGISNFHVLFAIFRTSYYILVFAEIDVMTLHLTVTIGTEIACLLNYLSIVLQKSIKYNSKYLN